MDKRGKKAVRFSSPFELSSEEFGNNPSFMKSTDSVFKGKRSQDISGTADFGNDPSFMKSTDSLFRAKHSQDTSEALEFGNNPSFMKSTDSLFKTKRSHNASGMAEKGGGDSWDAFDAKMGTSKRCSMKDKQQSKFMEMSSSQNKSLNIAEDNFSALSFKDADDLIAKDEVERMQFHNSNASFSNGLDEMEAPSLLSVTSYFQQGSSFPVPYICNDSTMFGSSQMDGVPTTVNTSNSRRISHKDSIGKPDSQMSPTSISDFIGMATKEAVDRKDSLASFFLGPQSDGLNKTDIMDYVLDYCKRRASMRISDASEHVSSNSSKESIPDRNDSGLGFGTLERGRRTSSNSNANVSVSSEKRRSRPDTSLKILSEHTKVNEWGKEDPSILMSDGASLKGSTSMDVSDVGFEKFKKDLTIPRKVSDNRYRTKQTKHEEFERKRTSVDEKNTHPGLCPLPYKSSTETSDKQTKLTCPSPPEKLVERPRFEKLPPTDKTPTTSLLESQSGQCHSTPVGLLSDLSGPKITLSQDANLTRLPKSSKCDVVDGRLDKVVRQKLYKKSKDTSSGSSVVSDTSIRSGKHSDHRRESKRSNSSDKHRSKLAEPKRSRSNSQTILEHLPPKVTESGTQCSPPVAAVVSEAITAISRPNILPESLNIMPVIHTGSTTSTVSTPSVATPCSCPHQCGQQANPHGIPGGVGIGLPIVIHIHLPCATPAPAVTTRPGTSTTDGTT